jgi:VanZ family protein
MIVKMKWAFAWAVLILILCAIPGRDLPHISFLELLEFDKFVHAGLFFVLMLLAVRGGVSAPGSSGSSVKWVSLVVCVLYGGALELMQGAFFEGRSADIYDFIANSAGAVAGLLFYDSFERKIRNRIPRK